MIKGKQKELIGPESDEVAKFEPKIIFALGRLQPGCRLMTCSHNCGGVSSQAIFEFIKEQYTDLDGDIESQVQTAIQSCVKSGIVCALYDGKYRLIGPNPKAMISNCTSRVTHGPRCCCLTLISCMSKTAAKNCCAFQWDFSPLKSKCNKQMQTVPAKDTENKSCCKMKSKKRNSDECDKKNNKSDDEDNNNSKKLKRDSSCQPDKKKSNEDDKKSKKINKDSPCQPDKDKEKSNMNSKQGNKNFCKKVEQRNSPAPSKTKKYCSSCGKLNVIYFPNKRNFCSYDE